MHIARITLISKLIVDQETSLRGYQVTGDARFLEPYRQAEKDVEPVINRLEDRLQHGVATDPQEAATVAAGTGLGIVRESPAFAIESRDLAGFGGLFFLTVVGGV